MRVGIITIHKLINFGTALQAFALQKYLQNSKNYQVELIDYLYPNSFHKNKRTSIQKLRSKIRCLLNYLFEEEFEYKKKFHQFQKKYFILSEKQYPKVTSLDDNPPIYDIYITGSDQVWNTRTVNNDPNFYLCFAPKGKPKIAFSACFSTTSLEDKYKSLIKKRLSEYNYIGVREKSGIDIIKDLNLSQNIAVKNTCDPTLLLTKEDYNEIASKPKVSIKNNYILVYVLMYAFNPYPALDKTIKQISKQTNLPIIVIGDRRFKYSGQYTFIKGIGPAEFLWLVAHASYVVTSSFHGLMFSLIYKKPFTVISPREGDSRIKDTLDVIGLNNKLIYNDNSEISIDITNPYTNEINNKLNNFINSSKEFLNTAIINSVKHS